MIEFRRLNLVESLPKMSFPIVFCRNVMIYFDKATQGEVTSRLAACLEPGGYLFIGHSESLTGIPHGLEYMRTWFGPTKMAFERLSGDEAAQTALADDLVQLARRHNMAGDAAFVAPAAYLEVVATRAG